MIHSLIPGKSCRRLYTCKRPVLWIVCVPQFLLQNYAALGRASSKWTNALHMLLPCDHKALKRHSKTGDSLQECHRQNDAWSSPRCISLVRMETELYATR